MKRLEQLPEIAQESLGGLVAGPELKQRILENVKKPVRKPVRQAAWVPAVCMALALVIGLAVGLPALQGSPENRPLIQSVPAGDVHVNNERGLLDLGTDNVNVGARTNTPDFRSIWSKGSNGSFPMIGVCGRYYRMLTSPSSVSSSVLGGSLGTVAEFTTEPALSSTDIIMSNKAVSGTEVYEVDGMGGTLIAAEVDGKTRLFQRVSFNGSALLGSESLSDSLQIAGHITMMELSDVGVITDSDTAENLFATLTSSATYESSGSISGKQSLLIELDNGLTLQLLVKNDTLGACGVWSCPEFFEAFEEAVK